MELNRERIIRGLACCKGSYDCFTCDIYKRGCAGFREGLARDALALIKELTEENKAWQMQLISQEEKAGKAYYDLACEVENLRAENENLHASCTELTQSCTKLTEENERLRAEKEAENKELFYKWKKIADETADRYEGLYQDAKKALVASTVRKMQERLKAQKFTHKNFGELVYVEDIDQIAKEMLEGANEEG